MKKAVLFGLLALLVSLSASAEELDSAIFGTWVNNADPNYAYAYKSDGSFIGVSGNTEVNGTYTASGGTLVNTQMVFGVPYVETVTYGVDGNTLTLTANGKSFSFAKKDIDPAIVGRWIRDANKAMLMRFKLNGTVDYMNSDGYVYFTFPFTAKDGVYAIADDSKTEGTYSGNKMAQTTGKQYTYTKR